MSFNQLPSHDHQGIGADSTSDQHSSHNMSRRQLMRIGITTAGAAALISGGVFGGVAIHAAMTESHSSSSSSASSSASSAANALTSTALSNAYRFQDIMMDAYAKGSTLRLSQSYSDQAGLLTTAFVYDNALTIIAYLRRPGGLTRAKLLGDSLLYAQQHDPLKDGRVRQGYFVNPFILPDGSVNQAGSPFYFQGSAVGDIAWSGLALAHLFASSHEKKYLQGALDLANWIFNNTYDTRGAGGYTFGVDVANKPLTYKSTEHNIDTYAFFLMLASLTGDKVWAQRAQHARTFIQAMWNPQAGYFWTGTKPDGVSINTSAIPADVQMWSYLALHDPKYACSVDWALKHVTTTDSPTAAHSTLARSQSFTGSTFTTASLASPAINPPTSGPATNPRAVWFEGTGHLVTTLSYRKAKGDAATASLYLGNIIKGQSQLGKGQTVNKVAIPQGLGVVAVSSPLNTGFAFGYYPYLHIGATAWFCMAASNLNPYIL
jgi:hypothetical protein